MNSTRGRDKLEGFVPVTEDWHAKVTLLKVSVHVIMNNCNIDRHFTFSAFGGDCTRLIQVLILGRYTNCEISLIAEMLCHLLATT